MTHDYGFEFGTLGFPNTRRCNCCGDKHLCDGKMLTQKARDILNGNDNVISSDFWRSG